MPRVLLGDITYCRVVAPQNDQEFGFFFVDSVAKELFIRARYVAHEAEDAQGKFFAVGDTQNMSSQPEIVMVTSEETKYNELYEYYQDEGKDVIVWVHQDMNKGIK